jgi:hypothetical protein
MCVSIKFIRDIPCRWHDTFWSFHLENLVNSMKHSKLLNLHPLQQDFGLQRELQNTHTWSELLFIGMLQETIFPVLIHTCQSSVIFSSIYGKFCSSEIPLHYCKNCKINDNKIINRFIPLRDEICQPKLETRILTTKIISILALTNILITLLQWIWNLNSIWITHGWSHTHSEPSPSEKLMSQYLRKFEL